MTTEQGTGGGSRVDPAPETVTKDHEGRPFVGARAGTAAAPPVPPAPPAAGCRDTGADDSNPPDDFPLRSVVAGAQDKRGRHIIDVLWAVRDFKIYKTGVGVSPHFSDEPEVAEAQWHRYAALGSELANVNYLVETLRPHRKRPDGAGRRAEFPDDPSRVHFERETARAIAQALLGNPEQGRASLSALTARLEKRLRNRGRVAYLAVCVLSALAISGLAALFLSNGVAINGNEIALAAIMGSIGALFSTAAGLPGLRLDPGAMSYMNFVYGGQRMLVGVLGAVVLYLALRAGVVHEFLPGADGLGRADEMNPYQLAFLSVLAGFSERLVPNMLEQTANGGGETPTPPDGARAQASAPGTDKGKTDGKTDGAG